MLLLNITNIIANEHAGEHLSWLQQVYIPLIKKELTFEEIKLLKILDSPNDGQTISLQLIAPNLKEISTFKETLLPVLHKKMQEELKGHLFIFDTTMESIDY
ncbi:DUF4286 family protein [Olivibacter sp. SDN3]|uniref:DUF4286 family protein n=1 Tax=Olivibacter sp. SDN3 TaxID=2764720 RepID=UPI0016511CAA|nr:DUF4286 family protein [Olivibacter sp. SDN3]QNL51361.1 DUF4286 family protein [Olivibacter sp. SDN3]